MSEVSARGGKCFVVTQFNLNDNSTKIILPSINELLMPIVSIIPFDLLAYKLACIKGYNPDKPRNLAKSVTVE